MLRKIKVFLFHVVLYFNLSCNQLQLKKITKENQNVW